MFKTYLQYLPKSAQLSILLGLWVAFMLINTLLQSTLLTNLWGIDIANLTEGLQQHPNVLLILNFIQQLVLFGIPAFLFAYLSSPKPQQYLGLNNVEKSFNPILIVLIAVLMVLFIGSMSGIIKNINLGQFANELQDDKDNYISKYLKNSTPSGMLLNLCLMAAIPAICEELFFRGVVLKMMLNYNKKPMLAFVLTSIFFGILHSSVYDLLPVFTASLILCIVYYYTQNLWNTILLHFLHNGIQVLMVYFISEDGVQIPYEIWVAIGVFVLTGVGIYLIIKQLMQKQSILQHEFWNIQIENQ